MKLVESVINISEGRDQAAIAEIARSAERPGVKLLHLDPGPGANRTVITLAGERLSIEQAAFNVIRAAAERIDMRLHSGEHPCIGAADVCPFVPLADTTMEECIAAAEAVGRRVADELSIPVYLYGAAARDLSRSSLAVIRSGGYRGLIERFSKNEFPPDFGGRLFNPRAGAVAIGAREILIAFNINLATSSAKTARSIAGGLRRERAVRPSLAHCQAIGWFIEEYGLAQVSTNITRWRETTLQGVFEAVTKLADAHGTSVRGSELVGLIPKGALLSAGRYYTKAPESTEDLKLIAAAVEALGLSEVRPFIPRERILEGVLSAAGWEVAI